ncbi:MAG: 7-cyano-7-deazaguanine synthase QueC [Acidobacteriota bacterium]
MEPLSQGRLQGIKRRRLQGVGGPARGKILTMARAVCLVSGGMDSCVAAARAVADGITPAFLHLTYGQRTQRRELRAFQEIADFYRVRERLVVDLSHLAQIGGSALTDGAIAVPEGDLHRDGVPMTYVPFRNANFLAVAVSWAEVLGAERIYIGAVEEDSSGYPDCREVFFRAFQAVIDAGTRPETRIEVVAPLLHLSKKEIVRLGVDLGAPLHLTWSCYQSEDRACGRCDSCLLRWKGFVEAGVRDPIPYAVTPSL